jgi:hypothetical protein
MTAPSSPSRGPSAIIPHHETFRTTIQPPYSSTKGSTVLAQPLAVHLASGFGAAELWQLRGAPEAPNGIALRCVGNARWPYRPPPPQAPLRMMAQSLPAQITGKIHRVDPKFAS